MCKYYHLNVIFILIYYTNKPGVGGLHFFYLNIDYFLYCYMIWKKYQQDPEDIVFIRPEKKKSTLLSEAAII